MRAALRSAHVTRNEARMIPVVTAAGVGQRGQGTFQLLSIGDDEFALFEVS